MGNNFLNPSLSASKHSQQQIPWSYDFHLLDKQPLNNTYILHYLPTSTSYKVKHLSLSKVQNTQLFRQIQLRVSNSSPFVVKLDKVQQYTVKDYCSEHEEVFLMFKHVENTLKEEILNRRFKNQRFSEKEIKVLIQAGVKGISYLKDIGCPPKSLNTSQILVTPQRAILVNDPLLSVGSILSDTNQRTVSEKQGSKNPIFSIPQEDYPSPQKLLYQNDLIEEYNEWLSALFTLGMIVLETIFLQPLAESLYDRGQKKIYYHKVKEKVEDIMEGVQIERNDKIQFFGQLHYQQSKTLLRTQFSQLKEIKEDLRRLLSHEPRIRESVHLKYKKTYGQCLYLNKPSLQQKSQVIGNIQQLDLTHNSNIYYKNLQNAQFGVSSQLNHESNSLFKKYSQINQKYQGRQPKLQDELKQLKENTQKKFRVVSLSMPPKQPFNQKKYFVMPATSEYLIQEKSCIDSEKKVSHNFDKKKFVLNNKRQDRVELYKARMGFELNKNLECEKLGSMSSELFSHNKFRRNFAWQPQPSQKQDKFLNSSENRHPQSQMQSIQLLKTTDSQGQSLSAVHFPSSIISTTPSANMSIANFTRSSTSYIKPKGGVFGGTSFDFDKYMADRDGKDKNMKDLSFATRNDRDSLKSDGGLAPSQSKKFREYLTPTDPSSESNIYFPQQTTFINFEKWKNIQKIQSLNQPSISTISCQPFSNSLSHFPFKEVGSINYDESHLFADKDSFLIQSYGTAMGKLPDPKVETLISPLQSSKLPKPLARNSLEINHSYISNLRNEGISFGSVDEELKDLLKFGIHREQTEKKPFSTYSSSQKVSVIDKIYDPQVMNSHDSHSLQRTPKKQIGAYPKRNFQSLNPSSKQKPKNSLNHFQTYLQTPQSYPAKQKLNSTIREVSCEESGVNHSNKDNESYENDMVNPNTQVSKYPAIEDRKLSQRKFQFGSSTSQDQTPQIHLPLGLQVKNYNNKKSALQNQQILYSQQQINTSHRVILYADGSRYMGQTDSEGESHGYGLLYYSDGQVAYDGQWVHGDFNGQGKLFNPYSLPMTSSYDFNDLTEMDEHLKQYQGSFKRDMKEGKGVFRIKNGEVYDGEFWQDYPHGKGNFYCRNGTVVKGIWERGKLKSITQSSVQQ